VKLKALVTLVAIASAGCASTPQNEPVAATQAATPANVQASKPVADKPAVAANSAASASARPVQAAAVASVRANSVFFDYDKFDIKAEYAKVVAENATAYAGQRDKTVVVEGSADERGSREYNLALGQKRAEAVKRALASQGVNAERIEAISYGEERPRNDGHDEKAWADNRRGDIVTR
jgi:peptidoglycan-associated lipoprotein